MTKPAYSWLDGRLTPWEESRIHVNSDAVLRGASVFEGLRAYRAQGSDEINIFRFDDHMHRLFGTSMRFLQMAAPYSAGQLRQACLDLLRANQTREDTHIRVVVYFDEVVVGKDTETPTGAFILAFPRPSSPKLKTGVRCTLSPWRRLSDVSMSPRVKASANYLNSRVAVTDAQRKGFDIPILLNERGKVSEGPGQNIFMVRGGVLATPRVTDNILEGVTRDTLLRLARRLRIPAEEREVDATELYVAEELFFCGTAVEVQPITEVDGYRVGEGRPGPLTERLQAAYFDLVRGVAEGEPGWLLAVHGPAARV